MARKVVDKKLDSKAERAKLKVSKRPYYREVGQGVHLGFRKGKNAGTWVVRLYSGPRDDTKSPYSVEAIGRAEDDRNEADGDGVLTFHEAVEKARKRHAERRSTTGKVLGPYTVASAIEDYLTANEGGSSVQDSRTRAQSMILPEIGGIDVASLDAARIRKWLSKVAKAPARVRSKKGKGPQYREFDRDDPEAVRQRRATANRTLTILKAALNFAFAEEKVPNDIAWRRVKPFKGVNAARVRYLTVDEARRFINASESDFRELVQAALQTGARYSELGRLKVEDFNRDVGTVAVRKSKTAKPRHLELTDEGIEFFTQVTVGRAGSERMFTKSNGEPWKTSHQKRPMKAANAAAKIDPPIPFHVLRHTWASLAIMNGVPPKVVSENLGHSDSRMVEKHYGHLSKSYVRDAIRKGAPRFGTVEPSNVEPITRAR